MSPLRPQVPRSSTISQALAEGLVSQPLHIGVASYRGAFWTKRRRSYDNIALPRYVRHSRYTTGSPRFERTS
eukprot:3263889-Amphidinium_carterae.1